MATTDANDDVLIIGIDFGTTFSGVAWAYSLEPNDIQLVTSWEAELSHCSDVEKAPTQLCFGDDPDENPTWGYAVPIENDGMKWFKLLLLDEKDVPSEVLESTHYQQAVILQKKTGKSPTEITATFLRKLFNHAIEDITRNIGAELLLKCKFHVTITLPAIWSHKAQQRMREAANMAGILTERPCGATKLHFISEPEAAALATLKDLSKRSTIKNGDTFVVCDAGGGTVDLISYVVESVSPFAIKEFVRGDGGLYGGVFLDENFLDLIKQKVSPQGWRFVTQEEQRKFLNIEWEHAIKPQFQCLDRTWLVELPESCQAIGDSGSRRRRKKLELNLRDILSVFSPITDKIEGLVLKQSNAVEAKCGQQPKYVILAGGLGRNPYLYDRLQAVTGSSTTVLQSRGSKPWTAICRGAVVQGMTTLDLSGSIGVKVGSRVARLSYGIRCRALWNKQDHLRCDKMWCEISQQWGADNQMSWFLKQGDEIETMSPVRHKYTQNYRITDTDTIVEEKIYYSAAVSPPSRRDSSVHCLCTITWNKATKIATLPTRKNLAGETFHVLKFEIEMDCRQGTADFAIYHEGKQVGGHSVEVEFH